MTGRLGDYSAFADWTESATGWGANGQSRVWFGGGVMQGLCAIVDEHLEVSRAGEGHPAAIGCVSWLTSTAVMERLARMDGCCVVIDKDPFYRPETLVKDGRPLPNVLPGLRMTMPDGEYEWVTTVEADGLPPHHSLGPVRIAGWGKNDPRKPLLHAKILVLGELEWARDGSGGEAHPTFRAESMWWGSANWTKRATSHLEIGTWTRDPALVDAALNFVSAVIRFSEPVESTFVQPEPNLVPVDPGEWERTAEEIERQQAIEEQAEVSEGLAERIPSEQELAMHYWYGEPDSEAELRTEMWHALQPDGDEEEDV